MIGIFAARLLPAFRVPVVMFAALCAGCAQEGPSPMAGTIEWDRIAVLAETVEPVREIRVHEGDAVKAGQVLLLLDTRRTDAEIAAAKAERDAARSQLQALQRGTRSEALDAARSDTARVRAEADNARLERDRMASLRKDGVVAQATLDHANSALDAANAALKSAEARQRELERGARGEDIASAAAHVAALDARLQSLQLARERLTVVAPRDGRVDALPFRVGDQPVAGATLASLLVGDMPYVRVYVPATLRAAMQPGAKFSVSVPGIAQSFDATLRVVRDEPAFTPYYALVGEDAARLVYRAELVLNGDAAKSLPAGLPASARWLGATPAP